MAGSGFGRAYRSPRTARCSCSRWTEHSSRYARFEDRLACLQRGRPTLAVVIPVEVDSGVLTYAAYVQVGRRRRELVGQYETQARARHLARRAACLW